MPNLTDAPVSAPVSAAEFARRMDRLGVGGSAPGLAVGVAVGVSGGGDSLALTVLLQGWLAGRGGQLLALTVDHGLRPESADEAAAVGRTVAGLGVAHRILRWDGEKPSAGVQAAARSARRRLLTEACAEAGIAHLALAHHRDDQAETVLLRLARGSGIDGLAGMAAIHVEGALRVIRPLLDLPHERLLATCRAAGLSWIDDPSNVNPRFARARLRAARDLLAAEGLDAERLCETARRAGRARAALETMTASLLAAVATVHREGWVELDPVPLLAAPEEIGLRALSRCLTLIGSAPHPIRDAAVERLYGDIAAGLSQGRTLAGCVLVKRRGRVLIAREAEAAAERLVAAPGQRVRWDHRFVVTVSAGRESPVTIARLGAGGWCDMVAAMPDVRRLHLLPAVRESLPSLWSNGRLSAVPTVGFDADGQSPMDEATFSPLSPLERPAFQVVS